MTMREQASTVGQPSWLDLYDYRQRMAALYREREAAFRAGADEAETLRRFRAGKDALFAGHPQSALDAAARKGFAGLRYFPYAPELRVEGTLTPLAMEGEGSEPGADTEARIEASIEASGPHTMRFRPAARVSCTLGGEVATLTLYWIDVYGGGLFLAFRDATCPGESYGGGRYLFDTVKGSDLIRLDDMGGGAQGYAGGRILLDFNYAYNPSCAYDPGWVCPLAPRENRLPFPIRAGERMYHG